ncbi:MAG: CHAD domain-containing protein [Acidobacteriota bacterium]
MAESDSPLGTAPASAEPIVSEPESSQPVEEQSTISTPDSSTPTADAAARPQPVPLGQIIVAQLETLRAYHQAVLETDDPEAIHKMRVTTRRLQASLDLVQENGDEFQVRKIKKRLRRWRRSLSRARNYDVFLSLIEQERPARNAAHQRRFELLKSILHDRRARFAQKSRAFLQGAIIDDLALRLGIILVEPPAESSIVETVEQPNGESAIEAARGLRIDEKKMTARATERLEQRLGEFQALAAQAHPTTDPDELHQLRIAAKRLRYLLETISEMGFGSAAQALAWLRLLQDRIGEWHDFEAMEEEILSITTRKKFVKAHMTETIQMLQSAAHLQKKKDALISKMFPIVIPNTVTGASYRLARALRRHSMKLESGR